MLIFGGVDSHAFTEPVWTRLDERQHPGITRQQLQELLNRCAGAETTSDVARRLATTTLKNLEEHR